MKHDLIVTRLDGARALLLQARDVVDAKKVADIAHAAEIYAKRQKLSQESIDYAHSVKVDAMTLMGDFLRRQEKRSAKHSQGGGSKGSKREPLPKAPPTLQEIGIGKKESSTCQKLSVMSEKEPERHAAIRDAKTPLASVFSSAHVSHNTGDNEWYTPEEFIESAAKVLGEIDLDPASTMEANAVVGAATFYTKDQNGLVRDWKGRVWMNPPFAGNLIEQFTDKLKFHFASGEITAALALVNNATETAWFQKLSEAAGAICFPSRRIKFWHPSKFTAAPLQGQAIIYLGTQVEKFTKEFTQFGLVCHVVR